MAGAPVFFDEAATRAIAETVRRVLGEYLNLRGPGAGARPWDNEMVIDGICSEDGCVASSFGTCLPNLVVEDGEEVRFYNSLGDIEGGDNIVIAYSHRSAKDRIDVESEVPTGWVLVGAGCSSSEMRGTSAYGMVWFAGIL